MTHEYTVLIDKEPRRRHGTTGEPQFHVLATISSGTGTAELLVEIDPASLRMAYTYIALSAARFLADRNIDITKATITTSWKQQHDQAASA